MAVRGTQIDRRGPVGWILMDDYQRTVEAGLRDPDFEPPTVSLSKALEELRWDPEVRVIVLTGMHDGEFYRVCRSEHYEDPANRERLNLLRRRGGQGATAPSAIQLLALIEKPVVARLNGDAIGFGQSLLWGCDIIVAREDAIVSDVHTGQQEVVDSNGETRGFPWAVSPGDGAMAFAPLYLPPTKLKEYLFLSRSWTAKGLAEMNVVNHAVPADELDDTLDEIVDKLLARPASVLARTKRLVNKRMVEQWNLTQDLSAAYERLDFYEHAAAGHLDRD